MPGALSLVWMKVGLSVASIRSTFSGFIQRQPAPRRAIAPRDFTG